MRRLESNTAYHEDTAVGSSILKKIHSKTLLHALTEEYKETSSKIVGSALHTALLDPEKFETDFLVAPKVDKRTKEGKAMWAEFEELAQGRTILNEEQMDDVKGMRDSILSHPEARNMITGGEAEYSYYVEDEETGLQKKCRPDYLKAGALIDIKTTSDASFEGFAREIVKWGYHLQAPYYLDVFNQSQSQNFNEFYFIAVENFAPYAVAVYQLGENDIEKGREAYKASLRKLAEFRASGISLEDLVELRKFGYSQDVRVISAPYYLLDKITA